MSAQEHPTNLITPADISAAECVTGLYAGSHIAILRHRMRNLSASEIAPVRALIASDDAEALMRFLALPLSWLPAPDLVTDIAMMAPLETPHARSVRELTAVIDEEKRLRLAAERRVAELERMERMAA
jgi:hypothetical protein